MQVTKKFNPKPGDKIICNNGEEFICCTKEFLQENGLAKYWTGGFTFGYQESENNTYSKYDWQCWDENGKAHYDEWAIQEVIPQETSQTQEQSVDTTSGDDEPLYTVDEVFDGIYEVIKHLQIDLPWDYSDKIKEYLSRKRDPQYQEYLRLKAIYE